MLNANVELRLVGIFFTAFILGVFFLSSTVLAVELKMSANHAVEAKGLPEALAGVLLAAAPDVNNPALFEGGDPPQNAAPSQVRENSSAGSFGNPSGNVLNNSADNTQENPSSTATVTKVSTAATPPPPSRPFGRTFSITTGRTPVSATPNETTSDMKYNVLPASPTVVPTQVLRASFDACCANVYTEKELAGFATGGVQANGQLRVHGTQLVTAAGRPIQLRGMSSHGIQWYPQYTNVDAIHYTKERGANLFRVAMYADSIHDGYNQDLRTKGKSFYLLDMAVQNAMAVDMYVIIDWHILKDENPLRTLESAKDFFERISKLYAGNPAVLYEICNEPNGDTTWSDIRQYAQEIIPIIRKNSPKAVIIVGTPHYSSHIEHVRTAPLALENIMYSYHLYPRSSDVGYAQVLECMLTAGFPIFVTEWGVSKDIDTGKLDLAAASNFIKFMKKHGLSWANWSLSNKDEQFSAIASHVETLGGWSDKDLTPSGKLVFEALSPKAATLF